MIEILVSAFVLPASSHGEDFQFFNQVVSEDPLGDAPVSVRTGFLGIPSQRTLAGLAASHKYIKMIKLQYRFLESLAIQSLSITLVL